MTSNRYDIDEEIYLTDTFSENDIPSWIKYLNNPKIYANTLLIPSPYTQQDGEDYLQIVRSSSNDLVRNFAVRLTSNDELIGACGLSRAKENLHRAEIGYWLAEPFWHRGLMPKIAGKTIEVVKAEWKELVRIEAGIFPRNKPSTRVMEKCGFVFEGVLRKFYCKEGEVLDALMYALVF